MLKKFKLDPIKLLLLFSLSFFAFAYGVAVGQYEIFPARLIAEAKNAVKALVIVFSDETIQGEYAEHVLVPTVHQHADQSGDELILVSGGDSLGYMKSERAAGCMAWLMDRTGDIKHVWTYDPAVWSDLELVHTSPPTFFSPTGLHLYEDGGLLVNFTGRKCHPPAIGIARFDRDSNLLWKHEHLSHHWFSIDDAGNIFVPAIRLIDAPISIGTTGGMLESPAEEIEADYILKLDPDGNIVDEISVLEALFDSGYHGFFQDFAKRSTNVRAEDPLHVNDVQVATSEIAATMDGVEVGDLLVSMRNINAVGVIDPQTKRFKWMTSGVAVRQHSPRFFRDGILLFDNRGGDKRLGGTQLVHVDWASHVPRTLFPTSSDGMPDKCYTEMAGHLDLHRDGSRVLMTICEQSTVWEVDLDQGKVLWEYIYVHPNEKGEREELETAKYVYDAKFPFNGGKTNDP